MDSTRDFLRRLRAAEDTLQSTRGPHIVSFNKGALALGKATDDDRGLRNRRGHANCQFVEPLPGLDLKIGIRKAFRS